MPKVDLYNMNGEVVGNVDLQDEIFGLEPNSVAVHMAVVNQLANRRQGTQSTKTKSEVRGGGIKPWRQKGTGRARQGSIRSAQWIKGGIVLGPKPRSYRYSLPKKLKKVALKSALSSKVLANNIIVIDDLSMDSIKTKNMAKILDKLNTSNALIVLENKNKSDENLSAKNQKIEIVEKSARNIPGIKTALVNTLNVFDIVKYDKFIITKDAVSKVGEVYA